MAKNSTARYTYVAFAEEVKGIVSGEIEVTAEVATRVTEKAQALIETQIAKQAYNASHPKKSTAKGASETTQQRADAIKKILPDSAEKAITALEINQELKSALTALQVANAVKFIEGAESTKVIRQVVNNKGLKAEREYTAYFRA